ncbi:MAG TPA: rhomboid family intramembrane serine protease [Edaphocola sp.]|nr:rhomboid family intramembrane serine protease [Edaphocola sp.]
MSQQFRPVGSFSILPPVIKNLIIINVIIYLLKIALQNMNFDLDYLLGLFYWESPYFRFWQPLTHIFMHGNFTHLLFNMFALWMFGNVVENVLGTKKFLILYFVSGFGAALCQLMVYHYQLHDLVQLIQTYPDQYGAYLTSRNSPLNVPMIGASGAVFGVLFAFGFMFPNQLIYFYFLFPIKAKYFIAGYAALELFSGLKGNINDNVAHFAHLGGMLFAYLLFVYWKKNGTLFLR